MVTSIAELLEGATPAGEVQAAQSLVDRMMPVQNRHARRKAAATYRSAKFKAIFEASHKAAVRKLNALAEQRRAERYGDPLD